MKHLVLIGMMGCGKTTCGQILSRRLGLPLVDTDQLIERQAGCSIPQIFARQGEDAFRQLERQVAHRLGETGGCIVATGGGLPLQPESMAPLRRSGVVFFLRRDPGLTYDTIDRSNRPLAQQGRAAFVARFAQREPIYQAAADYVIDCPASPRQAADRICALWQQLEGSSCP